MNPLRGVLNDVVETFRGSETADLVNKAGKELSKRANDQEARIGNVGNKVRAKSGGQPTDETYDFERLERLGMLEVKLQRAVAGGLQTLAGHDGED
jgi:hypothetical protein